MNPAGAPSRDESRRALPVALLARVFLPFAAGFFLSYLYRTVNAVIADDIVADTGLSAAHMGLLTSMYFLAFAAFQLPLGMLLDRFGPRRVEAALLLVAALGAALFATLESLAGLALGRALIGVGVSCCLMASFKAFAQWLPRQRLPFANGCIMTFGGLGALASTLPVELLLSVTDWHKLFLGLAVATAAIASIIFTVVPDADTVPAQTRLRDQVDGLKQVLRDRFFWRLTPMAAVTIGTSLSVQSLWAGPWLRDVQGLEPLGVAGHLMLAAGVMGCAYPLIGLLAQWLARVGLTTATLAVMGMSAFMLVIATMATGAVAHAWVLMALFGLLAAFSSLSYAALGQHFPPSLIGRASTALNLLVFMSAFAMQWGLGAIIGQWPRPAGGYAATGYSLAFGLLALLQIAALLWFFVIATRLLGRAHDTP